MRSSPDQFTLKWTDFQESVSKAFKDLREEQDFTDVTLVCEDTQQIEAHKLILSATSPFFKSMLRRNKHSHPLIYMKGVKSNHLISAVNYMYKGETRIYQEDIEGFLEIAKELGLSGLDKPAEQIDASSNIMSEIKPKMAQQPRQTIKSQNQSMNAHQIYQGTLPSKVTLTQDPLGETPSLPEFSNIIEQAFGRKTTLTASPTSKPRITKVSLPTEVMKVEPVKSAALTEVNAEPLPVKPTHPCHICRKLFTSRVEVREHVMKSPVCRGF